MNVRLSARGTSVNITPSRPVHLAGYSSRSAPFSGIADALEANILLLEDPGQRVLLVSLDLLYPGYELRRRLEERLAGRLDAASIFLASSHTHFAPATDALLPRLGIVDAEYLSRTIDAIADAASALLTSVGQPAEVTYAKCLASHSINRRLPHLGLGRDPPFWKTRWELRPNPSGPTDESVHVINVRNPAGETMAILWSYACHPVGFPQIDHVSADFPGVVRRALRTASGTVPVLYLQGFSGDIRPRGPIVQRGGAPAFAPFAQSAWQDWASSLATIVTQCAWQPGAPITGDLSVQRNSIALERLGPSAGGRGLSVHQVCIGSEFRFLGISAELVVAYTALLQAQSTARTTIPIGCLDGVPGYIPTSTMTGQGGYEVKGFMPLFGVTGAYSASVSELVEGEIFSFAR